MKRMRKKLRSVKAISPLVATLVLIGISVVGGLVVHGLFFSTAGTMGAKGVISVEAMDLVRQTDGTVTFSITVKNSGNKPATEINVKINGENPVAVSVPANGLQPGQQTILIMDNDGFGGLTQTYIVGNSCFVVVTATFSDGSTYATTTSVQCRM